MISNKSSFLSPRTRPQQYPNRPNHKLHLNDLAITLTRWLAPHWHHHWNCPSSERAGSNEHYTRLERGALEVTGDGGSCWSCWGACVGKYTPPTPSLNWGWIGIGVWGIDVGRDSWYKIGTRTRRWAAWAMFAASNSAASCLFHLFLLFWNQIFTCVSVRCRDAAKPARSELLKYRFMSKVCSSWNTWDLENTVLVFFFLLPRLVLGSRFSSLSKSSLSSTSGSESWTSGCWG